MAKITINKEVITLADLPAAKQIRKDWAECLKDASTVECLANVAIKYATNDMVWNGKLIKAESYEVTKNPFNVTIWATVLMTIGYDKIYRIGFDIMQANTYQDGQRIDTFIHEYKLVV